MKKILQISNYFYPHIGGIEQVARDIAYVLNNKVEQKIICFNETAKDGDVICKRNETVHDVVDGVEIIRCGCFMKKASQSISLTFGNELKKIMLAFKPDVVIFHYPNPYQAAYLKKYLNGDFKLVLYWHLDITKQKILGKLFHKQSLMLLKKAERVVVTSPVYIDGSAYLSRFKEKCIIIPNCINPDRLIVTEGIKQKAMQFREMNKDKIICFGVGRHIPYKGFKYLVEASKLLDTRFRIFIGGSGPLTEELKAEAADDKKIFFLGRVSDEDLIANYLAMDIFCFPSITKNEAFGIALAEAMYFRKPAVTFTIPGSGVNYVSLKNVTGLEVPNRDVKAYAEAMKKLARDAELRNRLGAAGKKRVEENFLNTQFKDNVLKVIEEL